MSLEVKKGGNWNPLKEAFVHKEGGWKPVLKAFTKVSGAWQEVWSRHPTKALTIGRFASGNMDNRGVSAPPFVVGSMALGSIAPNQELAYDSIPHTLLLTDFYRVSDSGCSVGVCIKDFGGQDHSAVYSEVTIKVTRVSDGLSQTVKLVPFKAVGWALFNVADVFNLVGSVGQTITFTFELIGVVPA